MKTLEDLYVGTRKYSLPRIEWSESHSAVPPRLVHTDLYSPDRKRILGREHKKRDDETQLIKLDRVHAITN